MNFLKLFLTLLFSILIFTSCNNKDKLSKKIKDKDVFDLIEYPVGYDTIDCSKFTPNWIPYPCLKLDKKSFDEIEFIYGKPNGTSIDTLFYGELKSGISYWSDISRMLSNVSAAKITYAHWELSENEILILYFIENNKQEVVFYGFLYNPKTTMIE